MTPQRAVRFGPSAARRPVGARPMQHGPENSFPMWGMRPTFSYHHLVDRIVDDQDLVRGIDNLGDGGVEVVGQNRVRFDLGLAGPAPDVLAERPCRIGETVNPAMHDAVSQTAKLTQPLRQHGKGFCRGRLRQFPPHQTEGGVL